jgi:hypothetical protein
MEIINPRQIVLSRDQKDGVLVRIKVIFGPFRGQEFEAKKVLEQSNGQDIYCYHITKDNLKTYFIKKDIVEIA